MLLQKTEINTGRQIEFDYLKGLFIPMILFIHAFQLLMCMDNALYHTVYTVCTLTGSTIFLFVMGLGSMYSRRTPKQFAIDGLKLIWYQVLWNVCSMTLPLFIGQGMRAVFGLPVADLAMIKELSAITLQYINIFFIAGVSYLFLALFKKWNLPSAGYLCIGILFLICTPFLYMTDKNTGIPALDYFLTMFAGGRPAVSLCFLPHFVYVMFGAWFGSILRRTESKKKLYLTVTPGAVLILLAYIIYMIMTAQGTDSLIVIWEDAYVFTDTFRMLTNLSCTLLAAAFLYAVSNLIQKVTPLHKIIMHFSKQTTPYYAVHPFFYMLAFASANCIPFPVLPCLAVFAITTALCCATVHFWEHMRCRKTLMQRLLPSSKSK